MTSPDPTAETSESGPQPPVSGGERQSVPEPAAKPFEGPAAEQTTPIVFFDGVCGLCNGFVDFLMPLAARRLRYASLQGETAGRLLSESDRDLNSIVYWTPDGTRRKSDAVIAIGRKLRGAPKFAAELLSLIPRPVRDLGYTGVAKIRYRVFGKRDTCRMPTPEERDRLLP